MKVKKYKPPLNIERAYQKVLLNYVRNMYVVIKEAIWEDLSAIDFLEIVDGVRKDSFISWSNSFEEKLKRVFSGFVIPKSEIFSISGKVKKFSEDYYKSLINEAFALNIFSSNSALIPLIENWVNGNAALIVNINNDVYNKIYQTVNRGYANGLRHETIRKQIFSTSGIDKGIFNSVETRAKLIARDQVNKLNGQLAKSQQEDAGIERYIWRSSQDEKVRPDHEALEGKLCSWNDSSIYYDDDGKKRNRSEIGGTDAHPGQDIQCRCHAEPYFDDLFKKQD